VGTLKRLLGSLKGDAPERASAGAAQAPAVAARPAAPTRQIEGRLEFHGLLWRPTLGINDEEKLVVAARAGLPHCLRCEKAMTLVSGPRELWKCAACGESRPGADADFFAAEAVISDALREFLVGNPDFRAASSLPAPQRVLA
jgi:ribosomal protein L37AE/L43A